MHNKHLKPPLKVNFHKTQKQFSNYVKHVCLSLVEASRLNIPPLTSLQHCLDAIHARLFQELPTQPTSTGTSNQVAY
jgi:hypothetical protein